MKTVLETHRYAPELNTLFLGPDGKRVRTPGIDSIAAYRKKNKPVEPFIRAVVKTVYDRPEHKWLERTYSGKVENRMEAIEFARGLVGGLVPGGRTVVRTELVGG